IAGSVMSPVRIEEELASLGITTRSMSERIIRRGGGLVLLVAGFGLEGYFHATRFQAEGASALIAWASAVVVALLYNLAFMERRRGAGLVVLAIFVGSFSV